MGKKKNKLIGAAKETIGVGVASMAGMGVMGTMANLPGMSPAAQVHANQTLGVAGSGLTLLNVGQMAKNAMTITDIITGKKKR